MTDTRGDLTSLQDRAAMWLQARDTGTWQTPFGVDATEVIRDLLACVQQQQADLASLREEVVRLTEGLAVANMIGDSFWEGLKALNLTAIDVQNPGRHIREHVAQVVRLQQAVELRFRAEAAEAACVRLREYVRHLESCKLIDVMAKDPTCTCGLDAVLTGGRVMSLETRR